MKKVKIRHLTIEDLIRYCELIPSCDKCPFINLTCVPSLPQCLIFNKEIYNDKFLNQEIEIDE